MSFLAAILVIGVHECAGQQTPCVCASQTKHRYHVRVLIPCYNETQEMVAATVQAAYNAKMPAGCDKTIYLCDDGKDKNKRKWCAMPGLAASCLLSVRRDCSPGPSHAHRQFAS